VTYQCTDQIQIPARSVFHYIIRPAHVRSPPLTPGISCDTARRADHLHRTSNYREVRDTVMVKHASSFTPLSGVEIFANRSRREQADATHISDITAIDAETRPDWQPRKRVCPPRAPSFRDADELSAEQQSTLTAGRPRTLGWSFPCLPNRSFRSSPLVCSTNNLLPAERDARRAQRNRARYRIPR
jgi:hypothetical protein